MPLDLNIIKKGIIEARYVFAVAIVFIIVMVGTGLYELSSSNKDLMRVLHEEAMSISEAISVMSDRALLCFDNAISLLNVKALNNAHLLEMLDYYGHLNKKTLDEIIDKNNIKQAFILNKDGLVIFDKDTGQDVIDNIKSDSDFKLLLSGAEKEAVIDLYDDEGNTFLSAVHRRKGGIIAVIADVNEIKELRRSIGIGTLVQAIGENEGIEYIVLQDEKGIITASQNITQMRKISGDSFLENALQNKVSDSRIYNYEGRDVFEVVSPFLIDYNSYGLFRVGLSMKEANSIKARSLQRLILLSIASVVFGIIVLSFLLISQSYSVLNSAYERIQIYTETVLENIADGIIVIDGKRNISIFNKASEKIFGRQADDLVGKPISYLGSEIEKIVNSVYDPNWNANIYEIKFNSDGSEEKLLSLNLSRISNRNDTSVIAVFRDITESKAIEENIRRTEQMIAMGKLASAVAHEVRNPLNAISMTAQRLDREFTTTEKTDVYRELTQMIKNESMRINKIIEDFLKFARPPKLNLQPVNVDKLLDDVILLITSHAEKYKININKQYSEIGIMNLDYEQIKQALLNLLLNAVEAMPDGGTLSIKAWREDNAVQIEINDTGKGIPHDVLPRIFDLYFTTKDTGTGLGLSIVQRIISEHKGWIKVDSKLNIGTTFRIYLPIEHQEEIK